MSKLTKIISHHRMIFAFAMLIFVTSVVALSVYFVQFSNQDIRQQADEGTGVIDIVFKPPAVNPLPGEEVSLILEAKSLNGSAIEGIQVVASIVFDGDIPNDLEFTPQEIPGLKVVGEPFQTTQTGGTILLAMVTDTPDDVINPSGDLTIGVLTFTAPEEVEVYASFEASKTKVLQRVTGTELVKSVNTTQFSIAQVSANGNENSSVPEDYTNSYEQDTGDDETNGSLSSNNSSSEVIEDSSTNTQLLLTTKTSSSSAQPELPRNLPQSGSSEFFIYLSLGLVFLILGIYRWRSHVKGS